MGKTAIFRKNTIGGFNKSDVLSYIDEVQKQIYASQEENEKAMEYLKSQNFELAKEIQILCEENDQLRKTQNEIFNEKVSEKNSVDSALAEIEKEKQELSQARNEFFSQIETMRTVLAKASRENDYLNQKVEEFEAGIAQANELRERNQALLNELESCKEINMSLEQQLKNIDSKTSLRKVAEEINASSTNLLMMKSAFLTAFDTLNEHIDLLDKSFVEFRDRLCEAEGIPAPAEEMSAIPQNESRQKTSRRKFAVSVRQKRLFEE